MTKLSWFPAIVLALVLIVILLIELRIHQVPTPVVHVPSVTQTAIPLPTIISPITPTAKPTVPVFPIVTPTATVVFPNTGGGPAR